MFGKLIEMRVLFVKMYKPEIGIVDHYAQILTKVMGNKKDVHMCIYHVS